MSCGYYVYCVILNTVTRKKNNILLSCKLHAPLSNITPHTHVMLFIFRHIHVIKSDVKTFELFLCRCFVF